jgi:hypothetical protein
VWSSLSSRLSKNSPKCVIIESLDGGAFTNNWSHIIPSEGARGKKKQRIKNGWPTAEESVRYLTEKKRRKKANMYLTHVLAERERERESVCVLLWGMIPPFPPSFLKRLKKSKRLLQGYYVTSTAEAINYPPKTNSSHSKLSFLSLHLQFDGLSNDNFFPSKFFVCEWRLINGSGVKYESSKSKLSHLFQFSFLFQNAFCELLLCTRETFLFLFQLNIIKDR